MGRRYCSLLSSLQQVPGEYSVEYSTFRCKITASLINSITSETAVADVGQSAIEVLSGLPKPSIGIDTKNNSLNTYQLLVVSVAEFVGRTYKNRRQLNANPIVVQVSFPTSVDPSDDSVLSFDRRYLSNFLGSMRFDIPHFRVVEKFNTHYVVVNFTSECYGTKDYSQYSFFCEDSGTWLVHNCSGRQGTLVSHCPKPIPSCSEVTGVMTSGLEDFQPVPLCSLESFNMTHTVCNCSFSFGAAFNYSMHKHEDDAYYYYDDATTFTPSSASYIVSSDKSVEFAVTNTYIPYRFADTFTEKFPRDQSP